MAGAAPYSTLAFAPAAGEEPASELRALFLQECHKRGALFGAPIYPCYRHEEADLRQTLDAVESAFELMETAHAEGDYERYLEGLPPQQVFRKH